MSHAPPLRSAAAVTRRFVSEVLAKAPSRLEAKVASQDGMPLLCAVEAALAAIVSKPTVQELVWLSGAPRPGVHVLRLQAFGPGDELLAEAVHQFEG
jgi:hypothetical protein